MFLHTSSCCCHFREFKDGDGRQFRRFYNHRIPSCKCGSDLFDRNQQRVVEWLYNISCVYNF